MRSELDPYSLSAFAKSKVNNKQEKKFKPCSQYGIFKL